VGALPAPPVGRGTKSPGGSIDKTAVGATGEPFELVVERGKIGELAGAIGARHADHRAAPAVPPPTFLTTMFHWERLAPGANPWHRVGMSEERGMHAEQEYVFHGPPPAEGTRLVCTSRIAEIVEKQGKRGGTLTFAVMVTEVRDETGRLVAEARMTGVETERAPEPSEARRVLTGDRASPSAGETDRSTEPVTGSVTGSTGGA